MGVGNKLSRELGDILSSLSEAGWEGGCTDRLEGRECGFGCGGASSVLLSVDERVSRLGLASITRLARDGYGPAV